MNANDFDEIQLLGWQTPQVNVDKELITVFAGLNGDTAKFPIGDIDMAIGGAN